MTPTGRKPDEGERYRTILETAARLICERGYEGTSMQEIAAACRMTKAGLYHHIQNKEQLLFAIMNYGMDVFEEQVLAPVQDVVDPVERLRLCMRNNIHLVTSGRSKEVIIILHEHATLTGEAREFIDRRKKRYVRFLEGAFADAIAQGLLPGVDPTVAAFSFLGMVLWVYKWFKPDGRLTEEQIADGMVAMILPGVSAGAAPRAASPGTPTTSDASEPAPLRMVPRAASGEEPQ